MGAGELIGPASIALIEGLCLAAVVLGSAGPLAAQTGGSQAPARGGDVKIDIEPTQLVLGEHSFARVDIHLPPEIDSYEVEAIRGTVDSLRRSGNIVFASYHPPKDYIPAVDVIAVRATQYGTKKFYGYAALPLHGQGRADIRTVPRAQATLRIGKRVFGPVRANGRGQARIFVVVPPGVTQGFDDEGNTIDLGVPQVARVAVFAFQDEMRRDAILELFCVALAPDGSKPVWVTPIIESEGGEIKEIRSIGDSAWVAEVTASTSESVLSIRAEIKGEDDVPFKMQLPLVEPPEPPPTPPVPPKKEPAAAPKEPEVKTTPPRENLLPQVPELSQADLLSLGWSAAAFVGAGTNFGTLNGFQGGLTLAGGIDFSGHIFFIGALGSVLYGKADSAMERFEQGSKGSSEDLLVQVLGALGYRAWFGNSLGLEIRGYLGAVLSRHMMDAEIVKDATQKISVEERTGGFSFSTGGGARFLWEISAGFLFLGARYLWIADDDNNQSLSLMTIDAGWGMDIGF